jgi:DNA-binding NtrC family response regulator
MNRPLVTVEPPAMARLKEFDFPGNIRELENMVERAIVVGNGKKITLKDLPLPKTTASTGVESLEEIEKNHIQQVLINHEWNITRTAKALKVDRVTLYNKIRKYDLKP